MAAFGNPNQRTQPFAPEEFWKSRLTSGGQNPFGFGQERIAGQLAPQRNVPGMPTNTVPLPPVQQSVVPGAGMNDMRQQQWVGQQPLTPAPDYSFYHAFRRTNPAYDFGPNYLRPVPEPTHFTSATQFGQPVLRGGTMGISYGVLGPGIPITATDPATPPPAVTPPPNTVTTPPPPPAVTPKPRPVQRQPLPRKSVGLGPY